MPRESKEIRAAGLMVFWTPRACERQKLVDALAPLGLDKHVPPARTQRSALRKAMEIYAKENQSGLAGDDAIVLPLQKASENGCECRMVERGSLRNETHHWFSCAGHDGYATVTAGNADTWRLSALYNEMCGEMTTDAIGKCLVHLATRYIPGTALRPAGGVYWVPTSHISHWEKATAEVMRVSGSTIVHGVLEANAGAIDAIRERTLADVEQECGEIMTEIGDGKNHADTWYKARLDRAASILGRVENTEDNLDVFLQSCRDMLKQTKKVVLKACMLSQEGMV